MLLKLFARCRVGGSYTPWRSAGYCVGEEQAKKLIEGFNSMQRFTGVPLDEYVACDAKYTEPPEAGWVFRLTPWRDGSVSQD